MLISHRKHASLGEMAGEINECENKKMRKDQDILNKIQRFINYLNIIYYSIKIILF